MVHPPDSQRRRRLWQVTLVMAGVTVVASAGGAGANAFVLHRGAGGATVEAAPRAPVAIVPGARVFRDGSPSPMLADRLDTAVDLYASGKVRKLLLSGDHGSTGYDEPNAMRRYVLARGVPAHDVFMDHAGFSTYDTMARARLVFQVDDALVVTQRFHLARAVFTANGVGLRATGVPADRRPYADRANRVREWAARVKAVLQVQVLHPGPRTGGPALPITGDGRVTEG